MTRPTLPLTTRRLAAAVLTASILAGCGGSTDPRPSADGAGTGPAAAAEAPTVDQTTPAAAAASYFRAVHEGRFGDACLLLAPVVQARYASAGQDCRTELAGLFDQPTRAAIGRVDADENAVEVVGDTAVIPGSALSRSDLPDGEPAPAFPSLRATRQDGSWYLVP